MEESISGMTNSLHSAGENEICVSNFENIDADIECQENSSNICEILEAVVDPSLSADVDSDEDEPEKANLQPETEMYIKSIRDANIVLKT